MARTETIEIPFATTGDKDTQQKLSNVSKAMTELAEKEQQNAAKTRNLSMAWTEFASKLSTARQALQTLKQGYDFAKEGAQIEFTKIKFDRLAASINTTGDALLDKMKVATKGTLSDLEAMQAATDLLSLGLAKNETEAIRLATVQSGLAMDTNQLVLALSNQTTMRFDQLGLSVDGFKEKVKALEEQGLSANDAFKEAFLQQAEAQLEKVGNAADTSAGQFAKFEAGLKNTTVELKEMAANALLPVIVAANEFTDAQNLLKEAQEEGIITEKEYLKQSGLLSNHRINAIDILEGEIAKQVEAKKATEDHTDAIMANTEAVQASSEQLAKQISLIDTIQSAENRYTEQSKDLAEQRAEAEAEVSELRAQGYSDQSAQMQDAINKVDEIRGKEAELAADRERQAQEWVDSLLEQNLARDGWTQAEFDAYTNHKLETGAWSQEVVDKMRAAWAEADKITASINNIPAEKTVTIRVSEVIDSATQSYTAMAQYYSQPRDSGGAGEQGQAYMIGRGAQPELFVAPADGQFIPNADKWMQGNQGLGGDPETKSLLRQIANQKPLNESRLALLIRDALQQA